MSHIFSSLMTSAKWVSFSSVQYLTEIIIHRSIYQQPQMRFCFIYFLPSSEPLCLTNGNVPGLMHLQWGMSEVPTHLQRLSQCHLLRCHLPLRPLPLHHLNERTKNLNLKGGLMQLISLMKLFLVCIVTSKYMLALMAPWRETNEVMEVWGVPALQYTCHPSWWLWWGLLQVSL